MSLSRVRIAIAQINLTVGDLQGNSEKIIQSAHLACQKGAKILVTPELSLTSYPPEDLLLRPAFQRQTEAAIRHLSQATEQLDLHVLIGHPSQQGENLFNAVTVLYRGQKIGHYYKQKLPNREVFDEQRYFTPGHTPFVFTVEGMRFGINICEDAWSTQAPQMSLENGAHVLLVCNASPYHLGKKDTRLGVVRDCIERTKMPVVYANLVGGQDELVFDGGSFVMNQDKSLVLRLPQFEESVGCVDVSLDSTETIRMTNQAPLSVESNDLSQVYQALTMGVRDYINKNNFPGALVGLSGGVDSALTLAVAVDALGADRVHAVMMPSPYTAEISLLDAREMAHTLGVQYHEIPIQKTMVCFEESLATLFANKKRDVTEENLQARIRGTMLMALSNKTGFLVLTTGNKSEMATGYCTLYGDMAGGFAVLKDIFKTLVYKLCHYRNESSQTIPERILSRPPSAELRPDQTDQDSLPAYEILDAILLRYMEKKESIQTILENGFLKEDVLKTVKLLHQNEYKRRQAAVGIRITERAFGRDWRYPITSKFDELKEF